MTPRSERARSDLTYGIVPDQYEVDAKAVAEAMLHKLRMIRIGRLALAAPRAGRTPGGDAPGRPGR